MTVTFSTPQTRTNQEGFLPGNTAPATQWGHDAAIHALNELFSEALRYKLAECACSLVLERLGIENLCADYSSSYQQA